jgi:hypothetical protein
MKNKTKKLSFLNLFKDFHLISPESKHYHDIVTINNRPDYRTIEVICLMDLYGIRDNNGCVIYNGYKIEVIEKYGDDVNLIFLGLLLELGSNLNLHLLSYFCCNTYQDNLRLKTSYVKLQEFFNETEENIKHALVSLQNLNLITFSENNNSDLIINLNKDNILKLEKKHSDYSPLKEDMVINEHYRITFKKLTCPHCSEEIEDSELELMLQYHQKFKND